MGERIQCTFSYFPLICLLILTYHFFIYCNIYVWLRWTFILTVWALNVLQREKHFIHKYIHTTYSCCQSQITKSNFRGKSKVKVHYHLSKAQTESAARELQIVFLRWPHTLSATIHNGLVFQLQRLCSEDWDVSEGRAAASTEMSSF